MPNTTVLLTVELLDNVNVQVSVVAVTPVKNEAVVGVTVDVEVDVELAELGMLGVLDKSV
jgi:hypothetical protein